MSHMSFNSVFLFRITCLRNLRCNSKCPWGWGKKQKRKENNEMSGWLRKAWTCGSSAHGHRQLRPAQGGVRHKSPRSTSPVFRCNSSLLRRSQLVCTLHHVISQQLPTFFGHMISNVLGCSQMLSDDLGSPYTSCEPARLKTSENGAVRIAAT